MNLYLISQGINDDYDTYSDAVVAADTAEDAAAIHPNGRDKLVPGFKDNRTWTSNINEVSVKLIGHALEGTPAGVICSSFHAG